MRTTRPRRRTLLGLEQMEDRAVPAVFIVANTLDAGPGSLRQAILDANAAPESDFIEFDPGVFSTARTITLTSGQLSVTNSVAINGPGAGLLAVDGSGSSRVFSISNLSAFISVSIRGMTITGGVSAATGAGLFIQGESLTLERTVVTGNQTTGFTSGGGIGFTTGSTLRVIDSTISGNTAGGSGGGIDGGFSSATVAIVGSTISENSALFDGGGIRVGGATNLNFLNSTIANNSGGRGGGIAVTSANAHLILKNSTVVENSAQFGGNNASGGISRTATATTGSTTLTNSVVAQNTGFASELVDLGIAGNIVNASSCLIGVLPSAMTVTGANNLTGTAAAPLDPFLGPLQTNGGPTLTQAPLTGSPLLDAGDNTLVPSDLTTDQRGTGFTRIINGTVDIGAVEGVYLFPRAALTAGPVTVAGETEYTFTVTYTAVSPSQIDVESLGAGDVTVVGPDGFTATPALVNVEPASNAGTVIATYSFTPPGGSWSAADNGTYTVTVAADQVTDTAGVSALPDLIGSYRVAIPITFVVTNLDDSGPGSLRQAVLDANANADVADSITFQSGLNGTIILTSGQLQITDSVTISGPGAAVLAVSGNTTSRVFLIDDGSVGTSRDVRVEGLTVTGGRAGDENGGGILNRESLTLVQATVSGNATNTPNFSLGAQGGGVHNAGILTLDGGAVSGNTAYRGGGIANVGNGIVTLTGTVVSENMSAGGGGGISNLGTGRVTLTNVNVSGNTADSSGGGILNRDLQSILTITGGIISGNSAGNSGGIFNLGTATLTNATVSGNTAFGGGGGIVNGSGFYGPAVLNLINATLTGNTSGGSGGGLSNTGTARLTDSLVSSNTSAGAGGGILNGGSVTVTGGTVSGNQATIGGGISNVVGGILSLINSTVSGNTIANTSVPADSVRGGGVYNSATATLTNATVSGNSAVGTSLTGAYGGGLFNRGGLTLTGTTVSGNVVTGNPAFSSGGGIFNNEFGILTLTNATVSGNSTSGSGGGVYNQGFTYLPGGRVTMDQVTVTGNAAQTGGGVFTRAAGRVTLANTIIANSPQGGDVTNTGTVPIVLLGVNLVEDGSLTGPAVINADPLLGPLADNCGPTNTHALLPGSPAVDAGENAAIPAGVITDQRGLPRVVRGVVDIGAFEVQNQAPTVADVTLSGSEDTTLALSRADFEAAFIDPDSEMSLVRIVDLPTNGTLTLNGEAVGAGEVIPAADLDSLAFQPAPDFFGTVTFRYTAADEYGFASSTAVVTLVITPVNDAPTVTAPGAQTAYEDVDLLVPPITVQDIDSSILTVTLEVANGTLTLGTSAGLIVSGDGTGAVTVIGAADALNAALATLTYRGELNFAGMDALTVVVSDGDLSAIAGMAIHVKSAFEQAVALIDLVDTLEAAGSINRGQATSLRAKLNLNGTEGDIDKVGAFLDQVQEFVANGILSPAEADPLLHFGGILLLSVSRR